MLPFTHIFSGFLGLEQPKESFQPEAADNDTRTVHDFRDQRKGHRIVLGRYDTINNSFDTALHAFKCTGEGPESGPVIKQFDHILLMYRGDLRRYLVVDIFYSDIARKAFLVEAHEVKHETKRIVFGKKTE